jgi:hypothetical protein
LDVPTARAGVTATEEPAAIAKPPAKRRKQAAAAVEAPRDGILPGALGDTGVRILADLGAAGGTAVVGVAGGTLGGGARPGLDGTRVASTPLVSYPSLLVICQRMNTTISGLALYCFGA